MILVVFSDLNDSVILNESTSVLFRTKNSGQLCPGQHSVLRAVPDVPKAKVGTFGRQVR